MEKIFSSEEKMVDGVILVDIEIAKEYILGRLLELLGPLGFVVVKTSDLNPWLISAINKEKEEGSLIILPGKGANLIYQSLASELRHPSKLVVSVFAKRDWTPGSSPIVIVGRCDLSATVYPQVKKIIVIDDVISSGQTFTLVYRRNSYIFPRAISNWIGFSWIKQKASKVKGFIRLYSTLIVSKKDGGKTPINSLSTLISNLEIAESCARRWFSSSSLANEFLKVISQMMRNY